MFSIQIWPIRWPVALSVFSVLVPVLSGCGGGGGGPQVIPTPTTAPVASGRIGWMSDRDGTFHIYVMNGDGTGQVRLTNNPGLERSPSWSYDGTRLVFSYSENRSLAGAEIYSVNSNGSGLKRLTTNTVEDNSPALSRDGQFVTWSQAVGNSSSIVLVAKSDGTQARQVSAADEFARTPKFDVQGRVVYSAKNVAASGSSARYQIMRVNRDGSGHAQFSSTTSNLYFPSVSPDGSTLLYVDDKSGDFQLYSSPLTTFAPQILSFSKPGDSDPSWTPDGRVLYYSLQDGNPEIYVAKLDGSAPKRLTTNAATDRLPSAIGPLRQ